MLSIALLACFFAIRFLVAPIAQPHFKATVSIDFPNCSHTLSTSTAASPLPEVSVCHYNDKIRLTKPVSAIAPQKQHGH